jgi:hypothetical protein
MSNYRRWTAPVILAAAGYVVFVLLVPIFLAAAVQQVLGSAPVLSQWTTLRAVAIALVSLLSAIGIGALGWIFWHAVCIKLLTPADHASFMKELSNFNRE